MHDIEELTRLDSAALQERFQRDCEEPDRVQADVLADILRRNADCTFGKRLNFRTISTPTQYRETVPLSEWPDYEASAQAATKGDIGQMFSGEPVHFLTTTGTTSRSKIMPESKEGEWAKQLTVKLRRNVTEKMQNLFHGGKLFLLFNPAALGRTESGLPIGAASGLSLQDSPLLKLLPFPKKILESADFEFQQDALMRFAVAENVVAFAANNIDRFLSLFERTRSRAKTMIDEIEQGTFQCEIPDEPGLREAIESALKPNPTRAAELRAVLDRTGDFLPSGYWPNLKGVSCWMAGSVGRTIQQIKKYLPENIIFQDAGYGASEGKFNIPIGFNTPAGTLSLWAAFYEFLPAEDEEATQTLTASELQDDTVYELVVTTYSGLYRYKMHDRVRVAGFTGRTPNIFFDSKSSDFANVIGEKTWAGQLVRVVERLLDENQVTVRHWAVFPDQDRRGYIFYFEPEPDGEPIPEKWSEQLDQFLIQESLVYGIYRQQGIMIAPEVKTVPSGWKDSLLEGKDQQRTKLPIVLTQHPSW